MNKMENMMLEMESVAGEDGVWYTCNTRAIRNFKFEMTHIRQVVNDTGGNVLRF